ncbi:phosphoribosylanthranilate isomerase [Candidatus Hakubella thermalkaliphila]|uniref:phosphoribosylanthranilate isomerase n=1 Tax=Candidatus Hakubella thermalkaliphila TaxID=2754717 RepID=UPI001FE70768|nr:phosphoribosylanthranilate isomerase [Candidatus Hakubella thermalkaliphila]
MDKLSFRTSRTRIKICGITNSDDALLAQELGADAVGFIFFARSPRAVLPLRAVEIIAQLAPFVSKVGVFVDEEEDTVLEVAARCGLDTLQLHSQKSLSYCSDLSSRGFKIIKAIRIGENSEEKLTYLLKHYQNVDAFLFDTYHPQKKGGTGLPFDWRLAEGLVTDRPVILSGGLNEENVLEAIMRLRPYAVDVSSGLERQPGKKDEQKMRQFFEQVRKADQKLREESREKMVR